MKLLNFAAVAVLATCLMTSCKKETCSDGIQNQSEMGVDCGGECTTACATCSDGIQNQGEGGVDCGGPCTAACATCTDGIQNQGETDIDCGGPCAACPSPSFSATVDGVTFNATFIDAYIQSGTLVIMGTNMTKAISLKHNDSFATGTYTLGYFDGNYNENGGAYNCIIDNGTITFTKFNTTTKTVSGTFSFNCSANPGSSTITNGTFANIKY